MKKNGLIIFNGGQYTQNALQAGFGDIPIFRYRSRDIAILLSDTRVTLLHNNISIDTEHKLIYNRFDRDLPMIGLISESLHQTAHFLNPILTHYTDAPGKIAQMIRCTINDVPIPESIIVQYDGLLKNKEALSDRFTFPVVVKTEGNQGKQVFKIESWEELEAHLSNHAEHTVFLIQEYIQNTYDVRLIIACGRYIGAIKRIARSGMFLNNVSQGGSVEIYHPTDTEITIAKQALQINKTDIAGVDIIHKNGSPLFLELNHGFGVTGYESIHTDAPVMQKIAKVLKKRYCS